jgi:hypothetical protein
VNCRGNHGSGEGSEIVAGDSCPRDRRRVATASKALCTKIAMERTKATCARDIPRVRLRRSSPPFRGVLLMRVIRCKGGWRSVWKRYSEALPADRMKSCLTSLSWRARLVVSGVGRMKRLQTTMMTAAAIFVVATDVGTAEDTAISMTVIVDATRAWPSIDSNINWQFSEHLEPGIYDDIEVIKRHPFTQAEWTSSRRSRRSTSQCCADVGLGPWDLCLGKEVEFATS